MTTKEEHGICKKRFVHVINVMYSWIIYLSFRKEFAAPVNIEDVAVLKDQSVLKE